LELSPTALNFLVDQDDFLRSRRVSPRCWLYHWRLGTLRHSLPSASFWSAGKKTSTIKVRDELQGINCLWPKLIEPNGCP
jgi:hypothetical protein